MPPKTKRKPKAPGAKARPRKPGVSCYAFVNSRGICELFSFSESCDGPKARKVAAYLLKYADWADAQAARRKGAKA